MASSESRDIDEAFAQLEKRQRAERARHWARRPKKIADVISQVVSRQGYARFRSNESLLEAWREAAGDRFVKQTRVGNLRRGVLEVIVGNSTVMQELTFAYAEILKKLNELQPDREIRQLRFRTGSLA